MLEEVYEQLLIERLELVEDFMDEREIVKSLKYHLMELKYQSPNLDYTYETLDTVLTNFYNYYNIEIEAGLVESVQININNNMNINMNPMALFNNIFNLINMPLNIPQDEPPEVPDDVNQDEPHDEPDDENELNEVPYNEPEQQLNANDYSANNPVFANNSFISVSLGGNEMHQGRCCQSRSKKYYCVS